MKTLFSTFVFLILNEFRHDFISFFFLRPIRTVSRSVDLFLARSIDQLLNIQRTKVNRPNSKFVWTFVKQNKENEQKNSSFLNLNNSIYFVHSLLIKERQDAWEFFFSINDREKSQIKWVNVVVVLSVSFRFISLLFVVEMGRWLVKCTMFVFFCRTFCIKS